MKGACIYVLIAGAAAAQAPTTRDLMLDLVYPAFNDALLLVNRGGPADEKDWAAARRSALALQESAEMLARPGLARDGAAWAQDVKLLADASAEAYRAAKSKDARAFAQVTEALDASCTACHKQYRPNVFPTAKARPD